VDNEEDKSSVAKVRTMKIGIFNELKDVLEEDIQSNSMSPKRTQIFF
jgi:hypothetical protein